MTELLFESTAEGSQRSPRPLEALEHERRSTGDSSSDPRHVGDFFDVSATEPHGLGVISGRQRGSVLYETEGGTSGDACQQLLARGDVEQIREVAAGAHQQWTAPPRRSREVPDIADEAAEARSITAISVREFMFVRRHGGHGVAP